MINGGMMLVVGNILIALLGLVRNVLIARWLSVEDFGIVGTFAVSMALIEMTSNLALDRLIVQAEDGDTPVLQSTLHTIQALRGCLSAIILFLIAGPLATLFGVPEVAWAYQALAAVPFLRGLAHLDMFRLQRRARFAPSLWVELAAQALATISVVPLALWLNDYSTMLYAILLQQLIFMVMSHVVAERRYQWRWDREIIRRAVRFGWPLLLNGILLFGIFQGDRIVVGSLIGMTALGWFSAAFTLTLVPTQVLAKIQNTFFLPLLSQILDDHKEFNRLSLVAIQAGMFCGVFLAIVFTIVGPFVFTFLYGDKYEPALWLLIWLAVMQAVRIAKTGPSIIAISKAVTKNPLIANILRVSMLPIAWIAVSQNAGIEAVVALAIIGEILAFSVSLYLLKKELSLNFSGLYGSIFTCSVTLIWIGFSNFMWPANTYLRFEQIFLVAAVPAMLWSMAALRAWIKSFFQAIPTKQNEK